MNWVPSASLPPPSLTIDGNSPAAMLRKNATASSAVFLPFVDAGGEIVFAMPALLVAAMNR